MVSTRRLKIGAFLAGLTCLSATSALGQQEYQTRQPTQARQQTRMGMMSSSQNEGVERFLASCWSAKNQAQIHINQLAQSRASDPQVKQFAQTMVQQQQQLAQKLEPLAGRQNRMTGQTGQSDAMMRQAGDQNDTVNQLISIENQIVDRQAQAFRQKLEQESGAQFDQCYLTGQVACHMEAAAAIGVIEQQASGQLKQIASQAKSQIDSNLQKAEQLLKQASSPSSRQASAFSDRNVRPASANE